MKSETVLGKIAPIFSGIVLLVSCYSLVLVLRAHASGLIPFVFMWAGFIGLMVRLSAYVLFVEKTEYAQRHGRGIIGSWLYLACGTIAAIGYVVLFPNWEK